MTSLCPLNFFSAGKVLLSSGGTFLLPRCHLYGGVTNVALPDEFDKLLSTMRSREISVSIIIQNLAQLKALFEKQWESIVGNCDEFLYLGGNEQSTHEYVSKLLGKETIDTNTYGRSRGRNGSYSTNYQLAGRELMTPDEVRIRQQINPKLKIGGVFLTMANDTNFRKDIVAGVKENFGKHLPVLDAVIPATVRLAEISTADKSIFRHEPRGRAAAAYGALVKEVERIGEKQRIRDADITR